MLVFDSLGLLGALEEGHIQNISTARVQLAQEVLNVRVPSYTEWVVPTSEDRITRLELQTGFAVVAAESGCGDISNNISEVGIQASNFQREYEVLDCRCGALDVLCLCPFYSVELLREIRCAVVQSVSLLECNISTPVANLNISLQP